MTTSGSPRPAERHDALMMCLSVLLLPVGVVWGAMQIRRGYTAFGAVVIAFAIVPVVIALLVL